ncbi:M96 mating-specific protein family, partial [Phytophthora palmivora]
MDFLEEDDDMRAFEATLNFVEEYGNDAVNPPDLPSLVDCSDTSNSLAFRLSDALPTQLFRDSSTTETSITLPLAMAEQLSSATEASFEIGTSSSKSQTSKQRKVNRPRKPQANPNRVRNELRFELAYLREKVAQLEQELSSLQLNPKLCGEAGHESGKVDAGSSSSTQVVCAWKGVAGRQRQRREDAERENARLRIIVDRQRKVAITLSELLRKRMAECTHVSDPYATERRLCRVIDFDGDIDEFQELFQHLEAAYHDVDDVFQANGLATMDIPTHDVHIREGVGGKYLEFFANKALPFPLQQTSEAAWDHFKGVDKHCGNGGLYEKAAKNLDQPYTVLEDFTKEMFSNNSKADMQMKQIVRRYVEEDRDVIVFVSKVSPIEIKNKAITGLTYHLRGYVVTKRSPLSTPGHDLSLLQFCSLISIDKEPGITAVMAFLQTEDDASVFEAALSFVDEYAIESLVPNVDILAPVSSEQVKSEQ